MDIFLQVWGGVCYLLNKVFLSVAEDSERERMWRSIGWILYLIGLPAWIIILTAKRDWMVAAIEIGGVPSMVLGLVVALKGAERTSKSLHRVAQVFAYGFLTLGVCYSLYDFGGIKTLSQVLEIGTMAGFLFGTYLLARKNPSGWLWFMLMNSSMGILMLLQDKPVLAVQQAVSLCFVIRGFVLARRRVRLVGA